MWEYSLQEILSTYLAIPGNVKLIRGRGHQQVSESRGSQLITIRRKERGKIISNRKKH